VARQVGSARLQENALDAGKQLIDAQRFGVMEEKISPAYARREYGVAIDERTWKFSRRRLWASLVLVWSNFLGNSWVNSG
jgi:hypothetical protein